MGKYNNMTLKTIEFFMITLFGLNGGLSVRQVVYKQCDVILKSVLEIASFLTKLNDSTKA